MCPAAGRRQPVTGPRGIGHLAVQDGDIRYSRGKNGSILEEEIYRKGILDEKKTYIYTFDERGNWTERTQYKNRTPVEITERVIEYY